MDGSPRRSAEHLGLRAQIQALLQYSAIGDAIEAFWLDPEHRRAGPWTQHRDINEVMLATQLAPDGFLMPAPPY